MINEEYNMLSDLEQKHTRTSWYIVATRYDHKIQYAFLLNTEEPIPQYDDICNAFDTLIMRHDIETGSVSVIDELGIDELKDILHCSIFGTAPLDPTQYTFLGTWDCVPLETRDQQAKGERLSNTNNQEVKPCKNSPESMNYMRTT